MPWYLLVLNDQQGDDYTISHQQAQSWLQSQIYRVYTDHASSYQCYGRCSGIYWGLDISTSVNKVRYNVSTGDEQLATSASADAPAPNSA